jgi:ABC-type phosphate transport system ATPase subunit/protein-tyrosine phosphatase
MSALQPVLRLAGFGVAFGEKVVLREVGFSVPGRGCTVLLGPSGTGKSTLLRTLAGFNRANPSLRTWGCALYGSGSCTAGHAPALVMQNSRLLLSNVLENLVCELPGRAGLTRAMQAEQVAALLQEVGHQHLLDCLSRKVVECSAGDQRAIAMLRQAMAAPPLLMVDEPTTGLDAPQAEPLLELMERLSRRGALLVVLHHLQQARRLADQAVLLANGVVEDVQASPAFFDRPRGDTARAFLATGSCPEAAHDVGGEDDLTKADGAMRLPSPRSAVSAACGPRGFLWLLPGQLGGTPWPGIVHGPAYDLQALRSVGVTRLVSLTEEPFDPALAAPFRIDCIACPMPDMRPPRIDQALALCRALDRDLAAGEVIAVHCHAGLGRTGTVLAAYWLWRARGAISALKALEDVRRIEPGWVQSAAQVKFLEEFALVVANRAALQAACNDPVAATHAAATVHPTASC